MSSQNYKTDYASDNLKISPNSIQAEQSVLGGLIIDNQAWDAIANKLIASDFYRLGHQLIFATMSKLADQQIPLDIITVENELINTGELEKIGGVNYLITLANDTPTAANIGAYADIVKEKSVLRQLIDISTKVSNLAFEKGLSSYEILQFMEKEQSKIYTGKKEVFVSVATTAVKVMDLIEKRHENPTDLLGYNTGLIDLNKITRGVENGKIYVVAGRPAMGKSILATQIAMSVANTGGYVITFTMEMKKEEVTERRLSALSGISNDILSTGKLSDDEWHRLANAQKELSDMNIFDCDLSGLAINDIVNNSCRIAKTAEMNNNKLSMIVIDYLQLMDIGSSNSTEGYANISKKLKSLAVRLDCPIIVVSQLNRSCEQRVDKRPIASDLRSSGQIEQDADVILFLYRDEVYNPSTQDIGIAELIINKNRFGKIGIIKLRSVLECSKFDNLAYGGYHDNN